MLGSVLSHRAANGFRVRVQGSGCICDSPMLPLFRRHEKAASYRRGDCAAAEGACLASCLGDSTSTTTTITIGSTSTITITITIATPTTSTITSTRGS